jgi:hypothetical protein
MEEVNSLLANLKLGPRARAGTPKEPPRSAKQS